MTAANTAARLAPTPARHEPHDNRAQPVEPAIRSSYRRMLAAFSEYVLHWPLRAYQQLVGAVIAVILAVLHGYGAIFTIMMVGQTCPEPAKRAGKTELSAYVVAGLAAGSARPRLTNAFSLTYLFTLPLDTS